jgi:hypothetical protein
LEKETLDLADIITHLGTRPFPMVDFMQDYLNEIEERKKLEAERKKSQEEKKQSDKKDDDDKEKDKKREPSEGTPQGKDEETIREAETIIR